MFKPPAGTPRTAADLISYEDLYTRWEQGNWSAMGLDFTEDARQWREELTDFERKAALWNYALFFWGEDAVADNLSPFIDAAPLEEQKYFLTTQQVDEARHAIFFKRFMHEVCGLGDGTMASGLQAIKPELTWGFSKVFDRLDTMADELRKDRSPAKLSAAVTLYHMVIEATLAQPGQHFITSYLETRNLMPAFREGMTQIAARRAAPHRLRREAAGGRRLEATSAAAVRSPTRCARSRRGARPCCSRPAGTATTPRCSASRSRTSARRASPRCRRSCAAPACRWRSCPGPPIVPADLTPRETATRGPLLTMAGLLGERQASAPKDEASIELVMDTVRRQLPDTNGTKLTVQFAFSDVEPWVLRMNGGVPERRARPCGEGRRDAAHELGRLARRGVRPRQSRPRGDARAG